MAAPASSGNRSLWLDDRLDERLLLALTPHDLLRHVRHDAVGHFGLAWRGEQRAPAALAVADEEIAAGLIVDCRVGEKVDPKPRRPARDEGEAETVVAWSAIVGEHRFEFRFQQFEPGDFAIAAVGAAVELTGLLDAGLLTASRKDREVAGLAKLLTLRPCR